MSHAVAIVQSSYIPWKGYFDLMNRADEFILFDDVQFTKRDWRSRNQIKTPEGLKWLSIPCRVSGRREQLIKDTTIGDTTWGKKHWQTLARTYAKAPFFRDYRDALEDLFVRPETHLSQINYRFIRYICDILEITTSLTWSMDYPVTGRKTADENNITWQNEILVAGGTDTSGIQQKGKNGAHRPGTISDCQTPDISVSDINARRNSSAAALTVFNHYYHNTLDMYSF